MRDVHLGRTLLATARMAIASELGRAVGAWPEHAALAFMQAAVSRTQVALNAPVVEPVPITTRIIAY